MSSGAKRIGYVLVGCGVLAACLLGGWWWLVRHDYRLHGIGQSVEEGRWTGYSEADLVEQLGRPTAVLDRYQPIGLENETPPPGPYKTLIYEGHGGQLYIWLHQSGESYQSFDSLWFEDDVVF